MRDDTPIDPSTVQPIPFSILEDDPRPIPALNLSIDDTLEMIQELQVEDSPDYGLDGEVDLSVD